MEIKPVYAVAALVIVFAALYFMGIKSPEKPQDNTLVAKELFMKAVALGQNASGYSYSYIEYNDNFPENFTLTYDGTNSAVEITSPLSDKSVYFMKNDTILCIAYLGSQSCSSVAGANETKKYVASMKGRLFDDNMISAAILDNAYKINHSIMVFSPNLVEKQLPGGKSCQEISYVIDYSNITIQEMSRFGVSQGSPMHFETTECINNATGEIYQYRFNYTFMGKAHEYRFAQNYLDLSYKIPIIAPEIKGDAISEMFDEASYKNSLMACYQKTGDELDKCISVLAQELSYRGLCDYAELRRDRCLVSLVPVTGDSSLCLAVTTPEFKDDCYIEMAGHTKNESWCSKVNDSTKMLFCQNVSKLLPPQPATTPENSSVQQPAGNESGPIPNAVEGILNNLDNQTIAAGNETNRTNNTMGSG